MKNEDGFTLLESLVALSLIAILLVTVFQVVGSGASKTKKAEQTIAATSIASSLLAELGANKSIEPSLSTGNTGASGNWEVSIVQRQPPKEVQQKHGFYINTFDVTVTIEIDDQIYEFNSVRSSPIGVYR